MVERGELPDGGQCAFSGEATVDFINLAIVVPRAFTQTESTAGLWFGLVWIPQFSWGFGPICVRLARWLFSRSVPVEEALLEHHRARIVMAPLRIASPQLAKVRRASQRRLKRLLRTVPIYDKLLDENPIVRIFVPPQKAPD
jgi:hypothetical protein